MNELIPPHGGRLTERLVRGEEREALIHQAAHFPAVRLDEWELADLELLAVGALSPLEGFLRESEYDSVVDRMQLADGTVWPLPVTLSLTEAEADLWQERQDFRLEASDGRLAGILHQPELYPFNPSVEAKLVYGTTDAGHPGVARILAQGPYYVGGRVSVVDLPPRGDFQEYRLTPAQTRQEFVRRGWRHVVGFQASGVIHRAHEYLLRCSMEIADGVMIHLAEGEQAGGLPTSVRMQCTRALLDHYFPLNRAMLVMNPLSLRYGGPREAIFHAIVRQNYGCSHFVIGRDNNTSVGKFYGPMDAQRIFEKFRPEQLAVTPLFFDNAFYCRTCQGMATVKTCAHPLSERVTVSSAAVRQLLAEGKNPPPEFIRPEVGVILKEETGAIQGMGS